MAPSCIMEGHTPPSSIPAPEVFLLLGWRCSFGAGRLPCSVIRCRPERCRGHTCACRSRIRAPLQRRSNIFDSGHAWCDQLIVSHARGAQNITQCAPQIWYACQHSQGPAILQRYDIGASTLGQDYQHLLRGCSEIRNHRASNMRTERPKEFSSPNQLIQQTGVSSLLCVECRIRRIKGQSAASYRITPTPITLLANVILIGVTCFSFKLCPSPSNCSH